GGVERYREHAADLSARARNIRHHARGGERDAALGDGDPLAVRRDQERVAHRLEIVKRLAHAHHDDVGDEALAAPALPSLAGAGAWGRGIAPPAPRPPPITQA